MRSTRAIRYILLAGIAVLANSAMAADFEVKMLNKGPNGEFFVFEPALVKVQPGDTVTFVPTDAMHNSESVDGMIPEGAKPWAGGVSEEISVTFEKPGVYGYKCTPHYGIGMVGVVVVGGDTSNLEKVKAAKAPGKAQQRFAEIFSKI